MLHGLLDLLRQRDRRARGFALGVGAHGLATALVVPLLGL